ncbi:MAG TPA: hypothetical protein VFE34_01120 [Dongiaceae bacterium]|nr:hypothetical protein [Dongiaceae bacterium]
MFGEPCQDGKTEMVKAGPFLREPFIEGWLMQPEPFQQRTAAESSGRAKALQVIAPGKRQEFDHIGAHNLGAGGQGLPLGGERVGHIPDRVSNGGQGLAEAVPSLPVGTITPKEGGQPFARLGFAVPAHQQCEQRLRLAGRQGKGLAIRAERGEPATQHYTKLRHEGLPRSLLP